MSEALERLSKLEKAQDFIEWAIESESYQHQIDQIKEVVSLAKASQQPSIDAMRFEAAKAAMQGVILNTGKFNSLDLVNCIKIADSLIAELQKTTP